MKSLLLRTPLHLIQLCLAVEFGDSCPNPKLNFVLSIDRRNGLGDLRRTTNYVGAQILLSMIYIKSTFEVERVGRLARRDDGSRLAKVNVFIKVMLNTFISARSFNLNAHSYFF